jgi:hypothetical protein
MDRQMSGLGKTGAPPLNGATGDPRVIASTWLIQDLALDDLPRMPETARQEGRKDSPSCATTGAEEDQNRHNRNGLSINNEPARAPLSDAMDVQPITAALAGLGAALLRRTQQPQVHRERNDSPSDDRPALLFWPGRIRFGQAWIGSRWVHETFES